MVVYLKGLIPYNFLYVGLLFDSCVMWLFVFSALVVVHVYGSPYDMGYAHGTLLKDSILKVMPAFYNEIVTEYEQNLDFLPKDVADLIAHLGVDGALDLTYLVTEPYTPSYFYEEMRGLADASGIDYTLLRRVHMIPELIKVSAHELIKVSAHDPKFIKFSAHDPQAYYV